MTALHETVAAKPKPTTVQRSGTVGKDRYRWLRFAIVLIITAIAVVPVAVVVLLALRPAVNSTSHATFTFANMTYIFRHTDTLTWLGNSLEVTLATVVVSVAVAAPAGYVLSRGRSKAVSGYSLLLFIVQSLPVITAVIPPGPKAWAADARSGPGGP